MDDLGRQLQILTYDFSAAWMSGAMSQQSFNRLNLPLNQTAQFMEVASTGSPCRDFAAQAFGMAQRVRFIQLLCPACVRTTLASRKDSQAQMRQGFCPTHHGVKQHG